MSKHGHRAGGAPGETDTRAASQAAAQGESVRQTAPGARQRPGESDTSDSGLNGGPQDGTQTSLSKKRQLGRE